MAHQSDMAEIELDNSVGEIQPESAEAGDASQAFSEEAATAPTAAAPRPCFLGFHSAVDDARCAATVIRWARGLDSSLLAYGALDGAVRVVAVDSSGATLRHTLRGHTRGVTDLDWSHNNAFLISASSDGTLALYDIHMRPAAGPARIFNDFDGPLTCCRFMATNPNIVFVGTQLGTVVVLNTSTGLRIASTLLRSAPTAGVGTAHLECLGDLEARLLVADSRGAVHTYRYQGAKPGVKPHLQLLGYSPVSVAKRPLGAPAGLQYLARTAVTDGPAVVITSSLSESLLMRYVEKGCQLEHRLQISSPPASYKIRPALWTPPGTAAPSASLPELLAIGGEDCKVHLWALPSPPNAEVASGGELAGHGAPVLDVAWSWDGERLASCDQHGLLNLWQRGLG